MPTPDVVNDDGEPIRYRELWKGEIIREGDEFDSGIEEPIWVVSADVGSAAPGSAIGRYRRRVPPYVPRKQRIDDAKN